METNREITYRKVPSLEYRYEVSGDGRIVRNVKSKRQLRQHQDQHGYYTVNVQTKDGHKTKKVHRLVAECWLGYSALQVDHIDRNKHNNHYSNLRYVTNQQNSFNKDFANYKIANQLRLGHKVTVDGKTFPSFTEAARYIGELHNVSFNTIRHYLKKRRNYIHGHIISYCNDCTL